MTYGPWTPELDAALRRLLLERGMTAREAGRALGRTAGACNLRAKKLGICRLKRQDWSAAEAQALRRLFETTTLSTRAMGERLNRTEHSVRWKLEQLGLHRGRDLWSEEQVATLARMRRAGASYDEIAASVGRGVGSVAEKARALGLGECPRRPWSEADLAALRAAIAAGETAEAFAARSDRTAGAAIRRAYAIGMPFPTEGRHKPWSAADDAVLRGVFAEARPEPVKRAAAALGRPLRGVRLRARKLGLVEARAPRRLAEADRARIVALARAGVPITKAAREVGRDVRTVKQVAAAAGLAFAAEPRRPAAAPAEEAESLAREARRRERARQAAEERAAAAERRSAARREAARLAAAARAEARSREREAARQAVATKAAPAPVPPAPVPPARPARPKPNLVSGFFGRRPAGPARQSALAIKAETQDAVARFLAERGVTRERLDPAEAVGRRLRLRGYTVVSRGEGFLVDGRIHLGSLGDLVDFARKRAVALPELPQAAE